MSDNQHVFLNQDEIKKPDTETGKDNQLTINAEAKSYLLTTSKWSKFIAIVGFAMIAIMVLGSIAAFFISPVLGEFQDFQSFQYMPMPFYFIGIFYFIMAVIYFFPCNFLYRFSMKTKKAMQNNDLSTLNEGLRNMKNLSTFIGVVTVISLALMLLIIPIIIFSIGMMQALSGGTVV